MDPFQQLLQRIEQFERETSRKFSEFERELIDHGHDGNRYRSIYTDKLFGEIPARVPLRTVSIATTGDTDDYIICPISGRLLSVDFSSLAALAASDTNYITWTITNLGQAGAGSAAMLAAVAGNTTKSTGGTALVANLRRQLTLSATPNNTQVVEGDRLLIRAAATGTLAGAVTFPTYCLRFA